MTPAILVNGFLAPRSAMLPLKWRLQRRGVRSVFISSMPVMGIVDVAKMASALSGSVNAVLAQTGASQVDLVGVSQGGLAALRYLHNGNSDKVRRFVALGTPFGGTWFAALGLPLFGAISRGVWQSLPTSALVAELTALGAPDGVEVTSVAIEGDPVAPVERCRLKGAQLVIAPRTRLPLRHQALIVSSGCADIAARLLLAGD